MPANTLTEMILGFSIILGTLAIYAFTLILRTRHARKKLDQKNRD
ncbi:MAG TPA: hypothetical protein PLA02_10475 [Brevefilum fermentans]|jgi:hypothetical protein|nr:hypothetical protein [Brevefilum fermentans]MDI9566297.1 hypothetical protein [Chloroflexota bacterium]OQB87875.1 MAG: hypothetical protein BWX85_00239 [Chloroflexi bacterium ADurb.Bin120]HOM67660.1 hypothetical protein [Brevefilum fermentans]HPX96412.1 hypothetical protein [Brevefilum fermentans]HQA29624.1 hypothetical protein [Brevefilum fermentans]